MVSEKIKLFNSLTKKDYIKGNTVDYKLREDLIKDIELDWDDIDGLFISKEQYNVLPDWRRKDD